MRGKSHVHMLGGTSNSASHDSLKTTCGHTWYMLATTGRLGLGLFLIIAGLGHFVSTSEFLAQVPSWMPAPELVIFISGVCELVLGSALIAAPRKWRPLLGWITAAFFLVIFPGNLWQFIEGRDAFGLDSDLARLVRLLFQPLLVIWALWATGALTSWRQSGNSRSK
jgi:uncharacterized membrane protein